MYKKRGSKVGGIKDEQATSPGSKSSEGFDKSDFVIDDSSKGASKIKNTVDAGEKSLTDKYTCFYPTPVACRA